MARSANSLGPDTYGGRSSRDDENDRGGKSSKQGGGDTGRNSTSSGARSSNATGPDNYGGRAGGRDNAPSANAATGSTHYGGTDSKAAKTAGVQTDRNQPTQDYGAGSSNATGPDNYGARSTGLFSAAQELSANAATGPDNYGARTSRIEPSMLTGTLAADWRGTMVPTRAPQQLSGLTTQRVGTREVTAPPQDRSQFTSMRSRVNDPNRRAEPVEDPYGLNQNPRSFVARGARDLVASLSPVLGAIRDAEAFPGDPYNGLVYGRGVARIADLENMTIAEVQALQSDMQKTIGSYERGGKGYASTAVGAYQTIASTLAEAVDEMGIDPETTRFDKATQDQIAAHLASKRSLDDYLSGAVTAEEYADKLAQEWAGFGVQSRQQGANRTVERGESYYSGTGRNKATISPEATLAAVQGITPQRSGPPLVEIAGPAVSQFGTGATAGMTGIARDPWGGAFVGMPGTGVGFRDPDNFLTGTLDGFQTNPSDPRMGNFSRFDVMTTNQRSNAPVDLSPNLAPSPAPSAPVSPPMSFDDFRNIINNPFTMSMIGGQVRAREGIMSSSAPNPAPSGLFSPYAADVPGLRTDPVAVSSPLDIRPTAQGGPLANGSPPLPPSPRDNGVPRVNPRIAGREQIGPVIPQPSTTRQDKAAAMGIDVIAGLVPGFGLVNALGALGGVSVGNLVTRYGAPGFDPTRGMTERDLDRDGSSNGLFAAAQEPEDAAEDTPDPVEERRERIRRKYLFPTPQERWGSATFRGGPELDARYPGTVVEERI